MYFPSKRGVWMTVILWGCAFLLIVVPFFNPELGVWMTPKFLDKHWIQIIVLCPLGIFLLWIWFKTGYKIEGNSLTIMYGPIKKEIKIEDVESIRETKNPFTAPALSMDRIEINYAKYKTVTISPKDKTEFLRLLLKQNPNIKRLSF